VLVLRVTLANKNAESRKTYDQSIELLRKAINRTKLGIKEKNEAVKRLDRMSR